MSCVVVASLLLVKLLPRDRFTIESPLPPAEVIRRLQDATARPSRSIFWTPAPAQPFQGSVGDDWFRIHPVSFNRNSFRPYLAGRVSPHETGAAIEITMAMHELIRIFVGIWLAGVGLAFVLVAIGVLFAGSTAGVPILVVLCCFFVFGSGLSSFGFWNEAGDAKRAVVSLLDGTTTA